MSAMISMAIVPMLRKIMEGIKLVHQHKLDEYQPVVCK